MRIYKLTMVVLFLLVMVRSFETFAQDNHWMPYEPAIVELKGRLVLKRKYGPPNFGENPKTDVKVIVPVLVLETPINVRGNPQDVLNSESVEGIRGVQLRFYQAKVSHKKFVGKKVRVTGTLVHAITGHQYTQVVMDVRSIEKTQRKTVVRKARSTKAPRY